MKDSFGNSFTKTIATVAVALVTLLLFVTTSLAGVKLGEFSSYLPLLILGTSSISISSIWLFGRPRKSESASQRQLAALEARIAELETRITNAEIVNGFEDRLAEKELKATNRYEESLDEETPPPLQQSYNKEA